MPLYQVKSNFQILKDNITNLEDAVKFSINYIKQNLQNAKFDPKIHNKLSSINIYNLDIEDKDKQ